LSFAFWWFTFWVDWIVSQICTARERIFLPLCVHATNGLTMSMEGGCCYAPNGITRICLLLETWNGTLGHDDYC
jgi:hypothetical protein